MIFLIHEFSDNFESGYDAIWHCEVKTIENRADAITALQALFDRLRDDANYQAKLNGNLEYLVNLSIALGLTYEILQRAMADESDHCRDREQGLTEINRAAGERKKPKSSTATKPKDKNEGKGVS